MRDAGSADRGPGYASTIPTSWTCPPSRSRPRETGLTEVGDASVYGTLRRLCLAGGLKTHVVPSDEGLHRKYYGLNESGHRALSESTRTWSALTAALDQLLDGRSSKNGR